MSVRQIILLLAITIAIGIAWQSLWNSPYGWLLYLAVAAVCGLVGRHRLGEADHRPDPG